MFGSEGIGERAKMNTVTFSTGEAVTWPPSPTGFAQIEFLHRRLVTIGYRRGRRWKRRRVRPERLVEQPLLIPLHNPFNRGVLPRSRTFKLRARRPGESF